MFIDIIFIKHEKSKIVEIFFVSIQGVPLALRAAGRGAPPFPPIRRDTISLLLLIGGIKGGWRLRFA
jgi:hypothetical protein